MSGAGARCIAPDFMERLEEGSFPPRMLLCSTPGQDPVIVAMAMHSSHNFEFFLLKVKMKQHKEEQGRGRVAKYKYLVLIK